MSCAGPNPSPLHDLLAEEASQTWLQITHETSSSCSDGASPSTLLFTSGLLSYSFYLSTINLYWIRDRDFMINQLESWYHGQHFGHPLGESDRAFGFIHSTPDRLLMPWEISVMVHLPAVTSNLADIVGLMGSVGHGDRSAILDARVAWYYISPGLCEKLVPIQQRREISSLVSLNCGELGHRLWWEQATCSTASGSWPEHRFSRRESVLEEADCSNRWPLSPPAGCENQLLNRNVLVRISEPLRSAQRLYEIRLRQLPAMDSWNRSRVPPRVPCWSRGETQLGVLRRPPWHKSESDSSNHSGMSNSLKDDIEAKESSPHCDFGSIFCSPPCRSNAPSTPFDGLDINGSPCHDQASRLLPEDASSAIDQHNSERTERLGALQGRPNLKRRRRSVSLTGRSSIMPSPARKQPNVRLSGWTPSIANIDTYISEELKDARRFQCKCLLTAQKDRLLGLEVFSVNPIRGGGVASPRSSILSKSSVASALARSRNEVVAVSPRIVSSKVDDLESDMKWQPFAMDQEHDEHAIDVVSQSSLINVGLEVINELHGAETGQWHWRTVIQRNRDESAS